MEVLQFTRIWFTTISFAFLLEGNIDKLPSSYTEECSAEVAETRDDLYLDDLTTCGENFGQVVSLIDTAIEIFNEAGFKLHKWLSNVPTSERKELVNKADQTFARQ